MAEARNAKGYSRKLYETCRRILAWGHQRVRSFYPPLDFINKFWNLIVFRNPTSFRIFSPDELVSNKLDAVFKETGRNFQWDVAARASGGWVIEILSEHKCQGMMQGCTLTGRTDLFPSYEAFLGIVHTMMIQYAKFVKMVMNLTSSANYF